MRIWIVTVALAGAAAALPMQVLAAPSPTPQPTVAAKTTPSLAPANATPTAVPKSNTAPTAASPKPTTAPAPPPTPVPPTPTTAPPTPNPTPAVVASPLPTNAPTAPPVATTVPQALAKPVQRPPGSGAGSVHGVVFYDANADGETTDEEAGVTDVEVTLVAQNGAQRTTHTDPSGAFGFSGLGPGTYHVGVTLPTDHVGTTDTGQDVVVAPGAETPDVVFGLVIPPEDVLRAMHGLAPVDEEPPPEAPPEDATDEQVIALSSVTSLPLRFAEGRDLMAQIGRRVLGDGLVWLGVPFRTQIDGGDFQYVNCGPASLTMVLAAFGLDVGPSQVRDYLNSLIDNYNADLGTSLDVLARIARDAGLTPMDLYSDRGGYRNWSTDAVRWHVEQGRPVITLVKYRNLPGHGQSLSEFDHYIVISGLTPNGFIYNDAAFATTLGYGLEISDIELQYAWENSSIPHHAVALGLAPDRTSLSFPEAPRRAPPAREVEPAAARSSRRIAEQDEAERAPLTLLPVLRPSGPLITTSDRWQDEIVPEPSIEDGAPMGLSMEASEQPTLEPQPGPGSMVPRLVVVLGSAWLVWVVWASSGRLARWRPPLPPVRAAVVALLGLGAR
jgi:SdrD B-like domain/Peptidase_C39 like family